MLKNIIKLLLLQIIVSLTFGQRTAAVMDFNPINISSGEAFALTERFITEIQNIDTSRTFLERTRVKEIMEEMGFH